jgi:hypothetical protein
MRVATIDPAPRAVSQWNYTFVSATNQVPAENS